jgi:hypothetical protein
MPLALLSALNAGPPPTVPPEFTDYFANCPEEDYSVTLRQSLAAFINEAKGYELFSDNSFEVEESYLPFEELVKLNKDNPGGKLYICQSPTDETIMSRAAAARTECGILFAFQVGKVRESDTVRIDNLVTLINELKYTARKFEQESAYSWNRTEAMKDEQGTPLAYIMLKQAKIFQSYFMSYYTYTAL